MTEKTIPNLDELYQSREDGNHIDLKKRPRGILSHSDREYLWGLRDYKHPQSELNRKQDIRERVSNALHDFPTLLFLMGGIEVNEVFEGELNTGELQPSLEAMIALVYLGMHEDDKLLAEIIENGVQLSTKLRRDQWVGKAFDVDVSIDINHNPRTDLLQQKLKEGKEDQLNPAEIGALVREGKIDSDDLEALKQSDQDLPSRYLGNEIEPDTE